ncbi:MAG: CPBP family intramembrane metalloprotease [bacterium]|nr:CPBP family intramembrane metalloprotease [bacterium]
MSVALDNLALDSTGDLEALPESPADYWSESARPLASLAFAAPILAAYELGVWSMGVDALRNGADVWLRQALLEVGFGTWCLLPVLTIAILTAWHHVSGERWRVRFSVVAAMAAESISWAFLLTIIASVMSWAFHWSAPAASIGSAGPRIIAFLGAGVYEELLFRMMLLPVVLVLFRATGCSKKTAIIAAVAFSSLLFALAHYQIVNASGDVFDWFTFSFRFVAGVFFAGLFLRRGFGVTVGAHALYDILVGAI